MGFRGAPIATAISFNMISFFSLIVAIRLHLSGERRKKAWKSIGRKELLNANGLLTLFYLGLAGAGQTASEWWSWELAGCEYHLFKTLLS
jgi:multidrug resistance protein, MATE family